MLQEGGLQPIESEVFSQDAQRLSQNSVRCVCLQTLVYEWYC